MKAEGEGAPIQEALFDVRPAWEKEWHGMPPFSTQEAEPVRTVIVHFPTKEDMDEFATTVGQEVTKRTETIWYPGGREAKRYVARDRAAARNRRPVFILSQGNAAGLTTPAALDALGVPSTVVIDARDFDAYAQIVSPARLLILPSFIRSEAAARDWLCDRSRDVGAEWAWLLDDDLTGLARRHNRVHTPAGDGSILRAVEGFAERYANLPLCGLNTAEVVGRRSRAAVAYTQNAPVGANMLVRLSATAPGGGYRFEDPGGASLAIRMLRDGLCTALFDAFLVVKSGQPQPSLEDVSPYRRNRLREQPGCDFTPVELELQELVAGQWVTVEQQQEEEGSDGDEA